MKHTGIAAVLGAALLVATFSAQMTAKSLVPDVETMPVLTVGMTAVPERAASVAAAMRIAAHLP